MNKIFVLIENKSGILSDENNIKAVSFDKIKLEKIR